jgi:hypothetical protein
MECKKQIKNAILITLPSVALGKDHDTWQSF